MPLVEYLTSVSDHFETRSYLSSEALASPAPTDKACGAIYGYAIRALIFLRLRKFEQIIVRIFKKLPCIQPSATFHLFTVLTM